MPKLTSRLTGTYVKSLEAPLPFGLRGFSHRVLHNVRCLCGLCCPCGLHGRLGWHYCPLWFGLSARFHLLLSGDVRPALSWFWVLLASMAVSNALHSVGVPGSIAAPLSLGWMPLGLGAMWLPLGFLFVGGGVLWRCVVLRPAIDLFPYFEVHALCLKANVVGTWVVLRRLACSFILGLPVG